MANENVARFGFHMNWMATDAAKPPFDRLEFGFHASGTSYDSHSGIPLVWLLGVSSNFWTDYNVEDYQGRLQSLQSNPGHFFFSTDDSVTGPGFYIDRARVKCRTPTGDQQYPHWIYEDERITGLLLGTNDVIYLQTINTSRLRRIVMWPGYEHTADFDLFVRCGAKPTPSAYNYASVRTDSNEFIELDPTFCTGGLIYIAIHSFSGSGQWEMMFTDGDAVVQIDRWDVGVNWNATRSELDSLESTVKTTANLLFGATDGYHHVKQITMHNNACNNCGGSVCEICFQNIGGGSGCCIHTPCTSQADCAPDQTCSIHNVCIPGPLDIRLSYHNWPGGIMHEFLHKYWAIDDEYVHTPSGDAPACGNSAMADPNVINVCTSINHGVDGDPGVTPAGGYSGWYSAWTVKDRINQIFKDAHIKWDSVTPDPHKFETFPAWSY